MSDTNLAFQVELLKQLLDLQKQRKEVLEQISVNLAAVHQVVNALVSKYEGELYASPEVGGAFEVINKYRAEANQLRDRIWEVQAQINPLDTEDSDAK